MFTSTRMWWFLLFIVVVVFYKLRHNYNYWKRRGVPGPDPVFIIGNIKDTVFRKQHIGENYADIYRQSEGLPFVGIYRLGTPCLLIRDPELIKKIVVKDFRHFYNNDMEIDKNNDPIFGRNPFVLKGEEWKKSRSQLTPCFTSGKMKIIFPLVENVSKELINYLLKNPETTTGLEAKELCTKFTLNSVASCAFGIDGKCFEDPNAEFRQIASTFIAPGSWQGAKSSLLLLMPFLSSWVKFIPSVVEDKLRKMVKETVEYREKNHVVRNDFLDMMSALKKEAKTGTFTDEDLTGHAASFFLDGFETSSNVMSYVLYELACNLDVQTKLREEIELVLKKHDGTLSYETVKEMVYLDACINESLRKNAPLPNLGKICAESYTYTTDNPKEFKELTVTIEAGTLIIIPIRGFHYDPKYFPEPYKYKPERFLRENKDNINKFAYMPFGEGPRICLGLNFGVLQIKIALIHLIRKFKVVPNSKTTEPLTFDPWYLLLAPKQGLWLDFHKI